MVIWVPQLSVGEVFFRLADLSAFSLMYLVKYVSLSSSVLFSADSTQYVVNVGKQHSVMEIDLL